MGFIRKYPRGFHYISEAVQNRFYILSQDSRECEGIIVDNSYANPYDGYDVSRKEGRLVRYR